MKRHLDYPEDAGDGNVEVNCTLVFRKSQFDKDYEDDVNDLLTMFADYQQQAFFMALYFPNPS